MFVLEKMTNDSARCGYAGLTSTGINPYINLGSRRPTHTHVSGHVESRSGRNAEANDHGAYS
jgi:hypothetical protein